ncbi:MAG: hypothetical protein K8R21_06425 [Leptospira sp.]|nr:hypothetical protein [Leptospira sp.]
MRKKYIFSVEKNIPEYISSAGNEKQKRKLHAILNSVLSEKRSLESVMAGQPAGFISPISVRFRLARNFRNFPFPIINPVPEELLLEKMESFVSAITGKKTGIKIKDRIEFANASVYFFDEDHIRLEVKGSNFVDLENVLQSQSSFNRFHSKDEFDFSGRFGFHTSCPTNSFRGNKLSALLDLKNLFLFDGGRFVLKILPEYISIGGPDGGKVIGQNGDYLINFHVKNFNCARKKRFISFINLLLFINAKIIENIQ